MKVHPKELLEIGARHMLEGAAEARRCVIHETAQAGGADHAIDLVASTRNGVVVRDVEQHAANSAFAFSLDTRPIWRPADTRKYAQTRPGEVERCRPADPTRRAGNQHGGSVGPGLAIGVLHSGLSTGRVGGA